MRKRWKQSELDILFTTAMRVGGDKRIRPDQVDDLIDELAPLLPTKSRRSISMLITMKGLVAGASRKTQLLESVDPVTSFKRGDEKFRDRMRMAGYAEGVADKPGHSASVSRIFRPATFVATASAINDA